MGHPMTKDERQYAEFVREVPRKFCANTEKGDFSENALVCHVLRGLPKAFIKAAQRQQPDAYDDFLENMQEHICQQPRLEEHYQAMCGVLTHLRAAVPPMKRNKATPNSNEGVQMLNGASSSQNKAQEGAAVVEAKTILDTPKEQPNESAKELVWPNESAEHNQEEQPTSKEQKGEEKPAEEAKQEVVDKQQEQTKPEQKGEEKPAEEATPPPVMTAEEQEEAKQEVVDKQQEQTKPEQESKQKPARTTFSELWDMVWRS